MSNHPLFYWEKQADEKAWLEESLKLLRGASEVLGHYTTSGDAEEEWNNDDVIDMQERIDAFLKGRQA